MKTYMVYSSFLGPREGAMLVIAHTVQEARAVGWREGGNVFTDQYIDFAAAWLRDCNWLFREGDEEKLAADIPHSVWDIRSCKLCECWGQSEIGDDGLCEQCRIDIAEDERRAVLAAPITSIT